MDDADAELQRVLGRRRLVRRAAVEELARVGAVDARQELHQGRLAGAVLPDQPERLAGLELDVHVLERLHAGGGLGDALDLEQIHTGASSRRSPAAASSSQTAFGTGASKSAALRCTCSRLRAPRQTVATAGWASGNWAAACGSVVPWRSTTSAMALA